jgi:hypothetical protein
MNCEISVKCLAGSVDPFVYGPVLKRFNSWECVRPAWYAASSTGYNNCDRNEMERKGGTARSSH